MDCGRGAVCADVVTGGLDKKGRRKLLPSSFLLSSFSAAYQVLITDDRKSPHVPFGVMLKAVSLVHLAQLEALNFRIHAQILPAEQARLFQRPIKQDR